MPRALAGEPSSTVLDIPALAACLKAQLPGFSRASAITIEQFSSGQSNPTYCLTTPAGRYVLRTKPRGHLLPSAHAIEREYAVMSRLQGAVPVPRMLLLCDDPGVIGQPFFVMAHVEGRILSDARMFGADLGERSALTFELVSVLARLHKIDYQAIGLGEFGRSGGYIPRQLARLTSQYAAAKVEESADMDLVAAWLKANVPSSDECSIVHGDYRSYNVVFATGAPEIAAVLDWELSTIGHPLADLAFFCLPYHLPEDDLRGFQGEDPTQLGVPSEEDVLAHYCSETGRIELPDWPYYLVFSLFRSAAIRAGVLKRAVEGNAVSLQAHELGGRYRTTAAAAAQLVLSRG